MKKGSERAIEVNIELNQTLALKIGCKKTYRGREH